MRRMFNSKLRETVWLRAKYAAHCGGQGSLPICLHCRLPVYETDDWDVAHVRARALGGRDGVENLEVAHARCNRDDGARNVVPAKAKADRVRRRAIGALRPGMGPRPLPGGRRSGFKIAVGGGTKPRRSSAERHAAFLAGRALRAADGSAVGIFAAADVAASKAAPAQESNR